MNMLEGHPVSYSYQPEIPNILTGLGILAYLEMKNSIASLILTKIPHLTMNVLISKADNLTNFGIKKKGDQRYREVFPLSFC